MKRFSYESFIVALTLTDSRKILPAGTGELSPKAAFQEDVFVCRCFCQLHELELDENRTTVSYLPDTIKIAFEPRALKLKLDEFDKYMSGYFVEGLERLGTYTYRGTHKRLVEFSSGTVVTTGPQLLKKERESFSELLKSPTEFDAFLKVFKGLLKSNEIAALDSLKKVELSHEAIRTAINRDRRILVLHQRDTEQIVRTKAASQLNEDDEVDEKDVISEIHRFQHLHCVRQCRDEIVRYPPMLHKLIKHKEFGIFGHIKDPWISGQRWLSPEIPISTAQARAILTPIFPGEQVSQNLKDLVEATARKYRSLYFQLERFNSSDGSLIITDDDELELAKHLKAVTPDNEKPTCMSLSKEFKSYKSLDTTWQSLMVYQGISQNLDHLVYLH